MSRHFTTFAVVLLCAAVLAAPAVRREAKYAWEDFQFLLNPTAQHAFEIGNAHFRAEDPGNYDIMRASRYYYKAFQLDPNHPMVLQQMARTAFVGGNSPTALVYIDLQLSRHADSNPAAHYIRALILGYLKQFQASEEEYEEYIRLNPGLWAAYNDLAWTRMQYGNDRGALDAAEQGLAIQPGNPWLLTMKATALYDLGRYEEALEAAKLAVPASDQVTVPQWVAMYPGNDPASIPKGMAALREASRKNLAKIEAAVASSTRQ